MDPSILDGGPGSILNSTNFNTAFARETHLLDPLSVTVNALLWLLRTVQDTQYRDRLS